MTQEPVDHPSPIRQRAISQFNMRGCKITRADIDRIWTQASEGFAPDTSYFSITTKREYGGISSEIQGQSIDELLDSVRRSTFPGDPDYLDNLRLYVSDSSLQVSRLAMVHIEPDRVTVRVEGDDPGWVRGRIGGSQDLFASTRAKFVPPVKWANLAIACSAFLTLIPVSFLIIISENISVRAFHHYRPFMLLILLLGLVLNTGILVTTRIMRQRGTNGTAASARHSQEKERLESLYPHCYAHCDPGHSRSYHHNCHRD